MSTKITTVTGYISPLSSGTRMREVPNTYSTVLGSYAAGAKVEIDQVIEYLENDPSRPFVKKGDLWGRVIRIDGVAIPQPAFMAIEYMSVSPSTICSRHYSESGGNVPTPVPVTENFLAGGASLVYDGENAVASITVPDDIPLIIRVNGEKVTWSL